MTTAGFLFYFMLDKSLVKHIAKLSRLTLSAESEERMQKDLSAILDYFTMLDAVDTNGIEPFRSPVALRNITRQDKPCETAVQTKEKIKSQFPFKNRDYLKVKEIL